MPLKAVSNNSLRKAIQRGEIELPLPFAGQNPSRRTIDRRLCGVEAFLKRVTWRLILKFTSSPKAVIIDSTELSADPRKDKGAGDIGKFYGYKLHLISTENSIPIGFWVTIGSVHDMEMFIP